MRAAWIVPCLILSAGCSSKPVVKTETVYVRPPPELLEPCERPAWRGRTYRDLVEHAIRLREALEACDDQVAAIREWSASAAVDRVAGPREQ